MAQQRQDRRGEVQAATASATGLACFIFRFLRRPLLHLTVRTTLLDDPHHFLKGTSARFGFSGQRKRIGFDGTLVLRVSSLIGFLDVHLMNSFHVLCRWLPAEDFLLVYGRVDRLSFRM